MISRTLGVDIPGTLDLATPPATRHGSPARRLVGDLRRAKLDGRRDRWVPSEEAPPVDEWEQADTDDQCDLDGDRPWRAQQLPENAAELLVGQSGEAHVDRIADQTTQEEGQRQGFERHPQ